MNVINAGVRSMIVFLDTCEMRGDGRWDPAAPSGPQPPPPSLPPSCRSQTLAQRRRSDDAFRADGAWLAFFFLRSLFSSSSHWRGYLKFPANPKGPIESRAEERGGGGGYRVGL